MRKLHERSTQVVVRRNRRGGFVLTVPNAADIVNVSFGKEDVYNFEQFFNPKQFADFYSAVETAEEYGEGSFEIKGVAPNEIARDIKGIFEKENKVMKRVESKETEQEKITVKHDVRLPGTDIILTEGDEILVHKKVEEAESLDKVMKKVSDGKELSKEDEKVLKAALDAAKGKDDEDDIVDKIMDKVRKGKDLTDKENKILGAAKDAEKGEKD